VFLGHRYLDVPTRPIGVGEKSVSQLLDEMCGIGFQGRNLGTSVEIWNQMLNEEGLTVLMGLSGAMVPAGMRRIFAFLIENRIIDCLVTTGANLFHDAHEALGSHHYLGNDDVDSAELFELNIDRIHDVYASEKEFRALDAWISEFAKGLDTGRSYSSRELIYLLGKKVSESNGAKDSILVSAFEAGVPVFVPALSDSSIGIGLTLASRQGHHILVDHLKDVDEITRIVEFAKKTGVVYVGGGVPKNFIQQTEIVASLSGGKDMGHEYAIQYTTDSPQWGGLSGCTFEEAVSWGKISTEALKTQVFVDATIALPLVSQALFEKMKKRKHPKFDVSTENLGISR
jgi:deoxyhypusine synthase